jgi:hypothetical protein
MFGDFHVAMLWSARDRSNLLLQALEEGDLE